MKHSETPSYMRRDILVANPHEKSMLRANGSRYGYRKFVLWFGAYGTQYVLVYADGIESALEEAAEALREAGKVGYFTEPEAPNAAEPCKHCESPPYPCICDLTYTESGYIAGWEWGIVAEDPSRADLIALHFND